MSEHNYKFEVAMSCGGCSGAVERVLKKLDGTLFRRSHAAASTADSHHRRQILQRVPGHPDRRNRRRRLAQLRHCSREDQEDWQDGQVWDRRRRAKGCLNARVEGMPDQASGRVTRIWRCITELPA